MKFIFSLFTIVMLTDSCKAPKQAIEDSNRAEQKQELAQKTPMTEKQKMLGNAYNGLTVTYQATSRGYANYVSVSENEVKLSSDRSLQKMDTFDCKKEDWEAVETLLKKVNPKTFQNLKAPSNKHTFDGAAHATLTLINGDLAYTTPTFDDGNPPAEIKELVNKVLAIGAKMKKQ